MVVPMLVPENCACQALGLASVWDELTLQRTTEMKPIPPTAPTVPVFLTQWSLSKSLKSDFKRKVCRALSGSWANR